MKQTAVEFILEKMQSGKWEYTTFAERKQIIEQAKEMEKQQIIDAYDKAYPYDVIGYNAAEQYYKETFNK